MFDFVHGIVSGRRNFLRIAAAAGIPAGRLTAAEDPAAEIKKLKESLYEAQFSHLPQLIGFLKRLRARFGPGVVEEVKTASIEDAKKWMAGRPISPEKRTLDVVVRDYASWTETLDYRWVEERPGHLKVRVTRCRWAEEMKKLGADGELGYAIICASDFGYCAGLNPAIRFSRTKTLMQGDDHCDHTYDMGPS